MLGFGQAFAVGVEMAEFEYKVVPAPTKGQKAKGVKAGEARFALALETLMNEMAADGWEYQRAETLPSMERSGFTGTSKEWRNILIFRRSRKAPAASVLQSEPHVTEPVPGPAQSTFVHSDPPLTAEKDEATVFSPVERRLELIKTPEGSES